MKRRKATIIHDPYRDRPTTYREFAQLENCHKMAVYQYCRRHGSLEGFRDRPPKYSNGLKPHTYTRNGEYVHVMEVVKATRIHSSALARYVKKGLTDLGEIVEAYKRDRAARVRLMETDDGRRMSMADFARAAGVPYNCVFQYVRHHGSLLGFSTRGPSRLRPKLFRHEGLGVEKSMPQWAEFYGVSKPTVRQWLRNHNGLMDGFEKGGRHGRPRRVAG